jgi:hypothetical protein
MFGIESYRESIARVDAIAQRYSYHASIETWATCNAAYNFCPYPTLTRQGDKMSDDLFYKIIAEISEDDQYPEIISLGRANEPSLDRRIFKFSHRINDGLPNTKLHFFSNASPLNEENIKKPLEIKNIDLINISFNDHRPDQYEAVMQLPYCKTLDNLDALHRIMRSRHTSTNVRVSRVGDGSDTDADYAAWVRDRFPDFWPMVGSRGDWMGLIDTNVTVPVPDVGCIQWYQLHILADGREAFCCIDAEGAHASGDANLMHALDIYNSTTAAALRKPALSRLHVDKCKTCVLTA